MKKFSYLALDPHGQSHHGQMIAENTDNLADLLAIQNLELIRARTNWLHPKAAPSLLDWKNILRSLMWLIQTGTPLYQAFQHIRDQNPRAHIRYAVARILSRLDAGQSITQSMAPEASHLPLMITLLPIAEITGDFHAIFTSLHARAEQQLQWQHSLVQKLAYPLFLIILVLGVLIYLLHQIAPVVTGFMGTNADAWPLPTRIIFALQNLSTMWPWGLGFLMVIIITHLLLLQSPAYRLRCSKISLDLPILGPLLRARYGAEIFYCLQILLKHGVPLTTSLTQIAQQLPQVWLSQQLQFTAYDIEMGNDLASSLCRHLAIPPLAQQMLSTAAATNQLTTQCQHLTDHYTQSYHQISRQYLAVLEPALTLGVGAMLILMITALILPLYQNLGQL